MRASKFTDAQKAFILKQADEWMPVAEVCRKAGISSAAFFNLKKKCGGLPPTEMRRLKQLEDENAKLKKLVADLSLDREMLQDVTRADPVDRGEARGAPRPPLRLQTRRRRAALSKGRDLPPRWRRPRPNPMAGWMRRIGLRLEPLADRVLHHIRAGLAASPTGRSCRSPPRALELPRCRGHTCP
jgi:putative transposase